MSKRKHALQQDENQDSQQKTTRGDFCRLQPRPSPVISRNCKPKYFLLTAGVSRERFLASLMQALHNSVY